MANVPLNDVVKRIKCDLTRAVHDKALEDPRFRFLTQWSAKVHLTVAVDNTATVNPGATIIHPLKHAGTSSSLGLGAGLNTEAVRTEDIEFFLAFPNLLDEFGKMDRKTFEERYHDCQFENGVLLQSDLDLKSIFDKALEPVRAGTLRKGPNVPFGSGGPPAIPANEEAKIRQALDDLGKIEFPADLRINLMAVKQKIPGIAPFLEDLEKKNTTDATTVASNITTAARIETDAQSAVTNIANPLYDIAAASLPKTCLPEITQTRYKIATFAATVSLKKIAVDEARDVPTSNTALGDETQALNDTITNTKAMLDLIQKCAKQDQKPKPPAEAAYDPIDLIGQTINFYITASGSVTPSWKLVRVTAPLSPTFASASRKDTNTLIISMGRPDTKNGQPTGATAGMNQQILYSIISQALTNRPAIP